MPELPEVETTKLGISPHIVGKNLKNVQIHDGRLRWPVPDYLPQMIIGHAISAIERRAKYLLCHYPHGAMMIHLGMSGSLRISGKEIKKKPHDHVIFTFDDNIYLHYHDPRRFGSILWVERQIDGELTPHPLLAKLGSEPLSDAFTGEHLYQYSRNRKIPVKSLLMNNAVVVGIGNIYANEALFLSGIHPKRAAGKISRARYKVLTKNCQQVLTQAINQGGTTLRDFVNGNGEPGYFAQSLHVYNREQEPCKRCRQPIKKIIIGQRASYFCPACQR